MRDTRRYKVDLIAQQSLCQANYARLLKILPFLEQQDHCTFIIPYQSHHAQLHFQRIEQTRYTQLLAIEIHANWSLAIKTPCMQVRIYEDAQLAEVISSGPHRYLAPSYSYPNQKMYQPDEKHQLNCFLADWLNHCLQVGHLENEVSLPKFRRPSTDR